MIKKVLCYHHEDVARMISEGTSYSGIARHFDVDPSTVREYCKRHNLLLTKKQKSINYSNQAKLRRRPANSGRKKWSADVNELKDLIDTGLSQRKIAAHYGVTANTIRKFMNAHGLTIKKIPKDYSEIVELFDSGLNVNEIASELGLSISLVYKTLNANDRQLTGIVPKLQEHHDEVQNLIYQGWSTRQISKHFRINERTARDYIKKYIDYPEQLKQANINKAVELHRNSEDEARAKVNAANPLLEYVSGYTRKQDPIKVRCLQCAKEFEIIFHTVVHKNGGRCPYCAEELRKELELQREAKRREITEAKAVEREERRQEREAERNRLREIWLENRRHNCPVCGTETYRPVYCSDQCALKEHDRRKRNNREARIQAKLIDTDITLKKLYERDEGICYICGGKCYYDDHEIVNGAYIAGPSHPSIDHIIALFNGGEHSWDNVALAHHICNTKKGIR